MNVDFVPQPDAEYRLRRESRSKAADALVVRSHRISLARGVLFLATLALGLFAWNLESVSALWMFVPVGAFVALVLLHDRIDRRLLLSRRAIRYFDFAIDRLEDRWPGTGVPGSRYLDEHHPYTSDLDVFGPASLFQLICRARTRLGEDQLSRWLSFPAEASTVRDRQAAIAEMTPAVDLREELALLDSEVHDDIDQNRLRKWAAEPPHTVSPLSRALAIFLGLAAIAAFAGWYVGSIGLSPLILVVLAEMGFVGSFGKEIKRVAADADRAGSGLLTLASVLKVIERQQFNTPLLKKLRRTLDCDGLPPSVRIARLHQRIQNLNNAMQNQFCAPLAFLLCMPVHLLHSVESWRKRFGPQIPQWLDAVGDFEALASLSGFAYENPDDRYPEVVEGEPLVEAEGLAHPLLPTSIAVRNDVRLGDGLQVLLVSGSNMSGKSTLLRTIGANVVLALCGAPVRARRMKLSVLQLGAAMRVHDSLQQGQSLFFAVITRLKQIVDLSRSAPPLLFLLDEILQGTNSRDRRLGAEGVILTLVEAGAVGLVTTHDLALTEIVSSLNERGRNIHFEDRLEEGRMSFDYRIRPGVVEHSNALELMRMMGLRPRVPTPAE